MEKYKLLKKVGHYYWQERNTGRIVISDESADGQGYDPGNPEHTDDGLLYLDTMRLANLNITNGWEYLPSKGYSIPLLTPNGESANTCASKDEFRYALRIARKSELIEIRSV